LPIPSKTRYPLESFDPRLRDIWLTAVRQSVEISFEETRLAVAFQNRLQQYRAALKRERPDDARLLYRAKCTRKGRTLLVTRQDSEFEDVLSQLDSQLLTREANPAPAPPAGPSATPLPSPSPAAPPSLEFSELFADIPVSHISEEDAE
jgi:hypothetical protein